MTQALPIDARSPRTRSPRTRSSRTDGALLAWLLAFAVFCLAATALAAAALAAPAAASSPAASTKPATSGKPAATATSGAATKAAGPAMTAADAKRAVDLALADSAVARVLANRQYRITAVTPWRNGVSRDLMGASVLLAPSAPSSLAARIPFVTHTGGESPWPPLEIERRYVRASDVTLLAVQVDLRDGKVVEVFPDHSKLLENTAMPFSYVPWLTRRAWVIVPIFVVLGLVVATRARRRPKRGWGSADAVARSPFEHLIVTVLLLAALAWYAYSVWIQVLHTAHGKTHVPSVLSVTWLFVLVPLLLFLGVLRLEYARGSRRRSWRLLLALALAVAAGALFLVHTITNLTLGTYLLAMCACLVAVRHLATPRSLGQRFVTDFRFLSR